MVAPASHSDVLELAVEGMRCMRNCGTKVQKALRSVDGVASAVVNFKERSARVVCVPGVQVAARDLVDAVENVGFKAALKARAGHEESRTTMADPLTLELLVQGMMCQKNCGSTVENALRSVDGVASVIVSFVERKATVTLRHARSGPTFDELVDVVECVGFDASIYDAAKAAAIKQQAQKDKQLQAEMEDVALDVPDAAGHPRAVFHVEGMSCAARPRCRSTVT
uniref:HMA domain-containing protein n=1 Tax=Hyaloperonospora arabidopsidis (strain Emoy2) TaxID=559515 RepID=M4B294_HYAAE